MLWEYASRNRPRQDGRAGQGRVKMFTAMACGTVALVVLIERRRQGFNGNPVGEMRTSRDYSRVGSYVPLAILIALGVVVDRIPW